MKLLILGAGGHGRVAADVAELSGKYSDILFFDDADQAYVKAPIRGRVRDIEDHKPDAEVFVAIGDNGIRERITSFACDKGFRIATLVHPSAVISNRTNIGEGTIIMANAVVNTGALIGQGVIINTAATVDHDCMVGDYVHLSPGVHIAGTVGIGKGTWVGIGASVSNNISICGGCKIGAGAVVVKDIFESGVYMGIPAEKRM